jgi:hypothetical protein
MNRSSLIKMLEEKWKELIDSYSGLTASEMLETGVTEIWSVKDVIAHVTSWEEESLRHLPIILEGGQPPRYSKLYGGIDAFNARIWEQRRGLELPEVLRRRDEIHQQLLGYLQSVPEEQFIKETRFRRRLKWDSFGHYPLHTVDIRKWRENTS